MGRDGDRKPVTRQSIQVDGTWDIETETWSTFLAGALYIPGQECKTWSWRDEDDFVDALLAAEELTLWAHFGGNFDMLWLAKHVQRRGITDFKYSLAGSSLAAMKIGKVTFRDSFRLMPMSLDKASQLGSIRKSSSGLACVCGKSCGGFCRFKREMSAIDERSMREYMVIDCKALYSALDGVCTFADRNDLDLKPTIGASSWATVERLYAEKATWKGGTVGELALYGRARQAYYGGRTQVYKPISNGGFHYDINSAYPAALAKLDLPTGERTEINGDKASRSYADGRLGLYRAVVDVSRDVFLPPLPVRTRFRSAYPVGAFGGWWTGLELQTAAAHGATIQRIDQGLAWSDQKPILSDFCRHVWKLRDEAGPKSAFGGWLKWYANSLTGKLAMRPESEHIIGADHAKPCPADDDCHGACHPRRCCPHQRCRGTCGATRPLGSAEMGLFLETRYHLSACAHVEWAAYLTAHARAQIIDFAGDGDDIVYCDTDSLFCEKPRDRNVGAQLGQWKLEDRYSDFLALAPKTYRYTDDETGKHIAASKGISEPLANFGLLLKGEPVTVEKGVLTLKSAVQAGDLFTRKKLQRQLRGDGKHFGDRVLGSDGRTYPQTVKEIDGEYELPSEA